MTMGMLRKIEEWRRDEEVRREDGSKLAEQIRSGELMANEVLGVEGMEYAEVVGALRALGEVWTGKTVQKQLYGALKRRERELVRDGKEKGMRAYLRRRQLEDAERRPDRRMQQWGGEVSSARGRANEAYRASKERNYEGGWR
jgi:hypothetical protein